MNQKRKKNGTEHYVPQFYLLAFEHKNGQVFVMNKQSLLIHPIASRNICGENKFFTLTDVDLVPESQGFIDADILDKEITETMEPEAFRILNFIRQYACLSMPKEVFVHFIKYLTWLGIANPCTKQYFQNKNAWFTNTQSIGAFISSFDRVFPFMLTKTWGLGICDNKLITSDHPVCATEKLSSFKDAIELNKTGIAFVLSPSLCLIGMPNNERMLKFDKIKQLSEQDIDSVNVIMMQHAERFIISHSEKALNEYKKRILSM